MLTLAWRDSTVKSNRTDVTTFYMHVQQQLQLQHVEIFRSLCHECSTLVLRGVGDVICAQLWDTNDKGKLIYLGASGAGSSVAS